MKKIFYIAFCLFIIATGISVRAQQPASDKGKHYTFTIYVNAPKSDIVFEENHPLSSILNRSWNLFNTNYRRVYEVSTGFSGQTVEIVKPAVYNAVIKTDKFIRKAVDKGNLGKEEAIVILRHIFDCANAIATESDTQAFEKELASTKTPESIIQLFNQVVLEYI